VSQATGLGITKNIVDCYAAILQIWQPGDRLFLFGFSRGAYTVRCVAAVVSLCGVLTTMADGQTPLFRDLGSTRKIANEAVKKVYRHVSSPKDSAFVEQRKALALQFRQKYHSDVNGVANVNPYFIGVFDTVAALGSYLITGALIVPGRTPATPDFQPTPAGDPPHQVSCDASGSGSPDTTSITAKAEKELGALFKSHDGLSRNFLSAVSQH
jgi:uncharacterized protein (DUF2235 family)